MKGFEIMRLYRDGLTDKQIVEKAGVKLSDLKPWRKVNGLSPNNGKPDKSTEIARLMEEWYTPEEIAQKIGAKAEAVKCWQRVNKIPEIKEMYKNGRSDKEMSEFLGVDIKSICYWRTLSGLNFNSGFENKSLEVLKLYEQGLEDVEIEKRVDGLSRGEIGGWRRANGLHSNRYPSGRKYYTIYLAENDKVIATGSAERCSKQLGIKLEYFAAMLSRTKHGRIKKYEILEEIL